MIRRIVVALQYSKDGLPIGCPGNETLVTIHQQFVEVFGNETSSSNTECGWRRVILRLVQLFIGFQWKN